MDHHAREVSQFSDFMYIEYNACYPRSSMGKVHITWDHPSCDTITMFALLMGCLFLYVKVVDNPGHLVSPEPNSTYWTLHAKQALPILPQLLLKVIGPV